MANVQQNVQEIEEKLNVLFVDKAWKLPERTKNIFVRIAPWVSLIMGILSIWSALVLWRWAHDAKTVATYVKEICASYSGGVCDVSSTRLTIWVWLLLLVIIIEGVLYLLAFSGLQERKKDGWNYLFYGGLVNVGYAVVSLFTSYDAVGNFIGGLIGTTIGFYFLFQIRSFYSVSTQRVVRIADQKVMDIPADETEVIPQDKKPTTAKKPAAKKTTAKKKPAAKKTSSKKKKPTSKK